MSSNNVMEISDESGDVNLAKENNEEKNQVSLRYQLLLLLILLLVLLNHLRGRFLFIGIILIKWSKELLDASIVVGNLLLQLKMEQVA